MSRVSRMAGSMEKLTVETVRPRQEPEPQDDLTEAVNLPRASQHLVYDHDDHKQHVDSKRPKEEFLNPPQVAPGNRLLLEGG